MNAGWRMTHIAALFWELAVSLPGGRGSMHNHKLIAEHFRAECRKTWRRAFCRFSHLRSGLVKRNAVFVLSRCTLSVYLREIPVIRQQ